MAEAAVENSTARENRFYCHQCSVEINPKLPEFTCPTCDNGFIEEITEDFQSSNSPPQSADARANDPAAQFAELWGRAFLESFSNHAAERDEGVSSARDRSSDEEEQESSNRQHHRQMTFQPPRISFRRTRPMRNQYLQGLFQRVVERMGGDAGGGGGGFLGFPINIVHLHGNPGDYAWGAGGFDAIITQLLNQLEGSGAPPADKEKIEALPVVKVSQEQVDKTLQCSVCMDDFSRGEEVRRLPCDHHFHTDCIVPWLKMHGTCPVCRKDLNGEDCTMKENLDDLDPFGGGSPDSSPEDDTTSAEDMT